ncbi:hypothetical protein V6N13_063671 [Hibiscus sabdariffa]
MEKTKLALQQFGGLEALVRPLLPKLFTIKTSKVLMVIVSLLMLEKLVMTHECNGLVRLQRQLISDILKGKAHKIYNADGGITRIKEAVCCRRVFLVLDDVDDFDTIKTLIGTGVPFYEVKSS